MEFSKLSSSPKNIIIVHKEEYSEETTSKIVSNSNAKNNGQHSHLTPENTLNSYTPYMLNASGSRPEVQVAINNIDTSVTVDQMGYAKQPRHNGEDLKVFKHKEVNSLIRNRILSLEYSVADRTIAKMPMLEVDRTIKEVMTVEEVNIIVKPDYNSKDDVFVPTSRIRELAKTVHEDSPKIELNSVIAQEECDEDQPLRSQDQPLRSQDQPLRSQDQPLRSQYQPLRSQDQPLRSQAVLKDSKLQKPLKPILSKQYSFTMDRKFHEEKDDEGWKMVAEIPLDETCSETDTEEYDDGSSENDATLESSDTTSENQSIVELEKSSDSYDELDDDSVVTSIDHAFDKKNKMASKPKTTHGPKPETEESSEGSGNETRSFDSETINRILSYSSYEDNDESLEEYIRRKHDTARYDPDGNDEDSEYDSEATTEYSEYTNNDRFLNYDYYRKDRDFDTQSETTQDTCNNDHDDYGSDSVFEVDQQNYYSERQQQFYTDDEDDETVIDENEFARERTYNHEPDYDARFQHGGLRYSEEDSQSEYSTDSRYEQRYLTEDDCYTDDDDYSIQSYDHRIPGNPAQYRNQGELDQRDNREIHHIRK